MNNLRQRPRRDRQDNRMVAAAYIASNMDDVPVPRWVTMDSDDHEYNMVDNHMRYVSMEYSQNVLVGVVTMTGTMILATF